MQQPTPNEALGYDLVIWIDGDGDAIATPYSVLGEQFMKSIFEEWRPGVIFVIVAQPAEFASELPDYLAVGVQHPKTKKLTTWIKKPLH